MKRRTIILVAVLPIVALLLFTVISENVLTGFQSSPGEIPTNTTHTNNQFAIDKQLNSTKNPLQVTNIAHANNQFAIDFYRQVSNNDKNQFFSPLSMYVAFSMLYEGAREDTATQLQDTFGFEPDYETRAASMTQMISSINRPDSYATLELANSMWLNGLSPLASYTDVIRQTYVAHIEKLPSSSNDGAEIINQWASDKTREKIPVVVTSKDVASSVMILANAVYFNGTWVTQFDKEHTKPDTFWTNPTDSIETNFMNLSESTFNFTQTDGIKVLKMPYKGDRLSMLLLLPDKKDGIKDLEEMLSVEKLQKWQERLSPVDVIVKIPKFTMETIYDLQGPLENLGIVDVFVPSSADLSGIALGGGLSVSKAIQKAFVDVNEEGTEAAAVTVIIIDEEVHIPSSFIADHPFLFMIQDDESGAILFMGRVSDPSSE